MVSMKHVCLYGLVLLGEGLAQTTTSIFVGFGFIGNLDASIAGSNGDKTTYVLSCPTANSDCDGLVYGEPSLTVTAGPSSVSYSASTSAGGSVQETTRVCTGTGSPVTAGLCTIYSAQGPSTVSVVQTLSPVVGGGPYYQTVILNGSGGGSASAAASTTATVTTASAQTTAATTTSTTTSKNAARKTDAPWPILVGAGVIAAMIGL